MQQIADGGVGGRGDPNPSGPGGGFKARRKAKQGWQDELRALLDGKIEPHQSLSLGAVPEIFRAFGGKGRDLVMQASKLRKVMRERANLSTDTIANLPDMIANPFMAINQHGGDRTGDLLLVTDHLTKDGEVVVVAIKRSGKTDKDAAASVVVTFYGKEKFDDMVLTAQERGQIMYLSGERAGSGYEHTGANSLNAPLSGTLQRLRASSKIRTPRSVFKGGQTPGGDPEMRAPKRQNPGLEAASSVTAESAKQLMSDVLTQVMAGKSGVNILALTPGRALMNELGGKMPSVKKYLRLKEQMDTLHNEHHAKTDKLAQEWREILTKDHDANKRLMDLMHDRTIEGQDPSKPFMPVAEPRNPDLVAKYGLRSKTGWAAKT
ncbi:hypothetical protein SAMN05444007_106152 [Cribrihabitans marinus]|uniref:Phage MuF C-terminal domain-containing protein n=1 Tax=Cribrihabitans marinus TaxID=1227549 RepID=A0A1H7AWU9_9RHOB|nr:hypothetical protein [Cribrihabitans marinus]GGH32422.1 hypothetical protein GCM10010973_23880 [Cribrihabitans marinus]SEJ68397.1 hypothetical protein SAMN05444007_106152 [Cribrihabitans marinus]